MFRYPDFFKVGFLNQANHDNRNYEDDWGERYNGLTSNADYEAQANQNYAKNLKGKLPTTRCQWPATYLDNF